jgi:hypothetical protein
VLIERDITAPDGDNTAFFFCDEDEFPNFFGTSAAAAHIAAATAFAISEHVLTGSLR